MTTITRLSEDVFTTGQIDASDVPAIAAHGFKTLICNRPDFEGGPTQPAFDAIETAAKAAGLETLYLPVVPGCFTPEQITAFADAIATLPKPILAYCRTGGRVTSLFQSACALSR
ncbi:TIGR01244 family sulfur transferase [Segnochrobactraceae bacterium EtOH-i3]